MTDAVAATETNLTNPSQDGPATPNADRPQGKTPADTPADKPADTPADKPADAPADAPADKPADAPADAPQLGDPERKEPLGTTTHEDGTITYEGTGYPGLDMALEFVGKLGIGLDHPAMQATRSGDFSLLEAHLASLGDKATGYEKFIALANEALAQHTAKTEKRNAELNNAINAVLGDSSKEILAWASNNATDAERAEINAMLAAGPVQARAAANLILGAYQKAGGTVVKPASATTGNPGNGGTPNQQSQGTLTNVEFAMESAKLHRRHGAAYVNTPEYRALAARLR